MTSAWDAVAFAAGASRDRCSGAGVPLWSPEDRQPAPPAGNRCRDQCRLMQHDDQTVGRRRTFLLGTDDAEITIGGDGRDRPALPVAPGTLIGGLDEEGRSTLHQIRKTLVAHVRADRDLAAPLP